MRKRERERERERERDTDRGIFGESVGETGARHPHSKAEQKNVVQDHL